MRTLILKVARQSGALPALIAVAIAPAACSGNVQVDSSSGSSQGGSETTSSSTMTGGAGQGGTGGQAGTGGIVLTGGTGGTGGNVCGDGAYLGTVTVPLPQPGVPAEPGQLCQTVMMPVVSNTAARVTLTKYSPSTYLAMGFVAIDPALAGLVVGTPSISVTQAEPPELSQMTISDVQPAAGGFSFHAEWPPPLDLTLPQSARLLVKVTFDLLCDAGTGETRTIESNTVVYYCLVGEDLSWVSSGDECKVCDVIAEMAPSPIVPDKREDDLPLARALRLRVVPLAVIGRSFVLLAENDGGSSVEVEWQASEGSVETVAPDVVVWTPPLGAEAPLIQAIATSAHAAAVASYSAGEVAQ